MAVEVNIPRKSYAAGEIGNTLYARDDLGRWQIGVARCENMVVMIEGGLTRAPGTRYVLPLKNESQVGRLIPFNYSGSDKYMLVINGGAVRFVRNGGFIESSPGVPYELAVPWAAADLENIRAQQDGNKVHVFCDGYEPRTITRAGHASWSLADYEPTGGPVDAQNLDVAKTISASAGSGTVTLRANHDLFVAGDVGGVWRLDEFDLSTIPHWKASETLTIPTEAIPAGTNIGNFTNPANAWDGNDAVVATRASSDGYIGRTYSPASAIRQMRIKGHTADVAGAYIYLYGKNGAAPSGPTDGVFLGGIGAVFGDFDRIITASDQSTVWDHIFIRFWQIGSGTPTATVKELIPDRYTSGGEPVLRRHLGHVYQAISGSNTGTVAPTHDEGDALSEPSGVIWRFYHRSRGFVRITAYTDPRVVTGLVLERLPDSVVTNGTYRWFPGEWSASRGWPKRVGLHDGRLVSGRDDKLWIERPNIERSFEVLPGDDPADPDTAIAMRLRPTRNVLPWVEWVHSAGALILGLRDREVILRAADLFAPLTIDKLKTVPGSSEGSAPHEPADVDDGLIFIGRSRRRLHFLRLDNLNEATATQEITKANRTLLRGNAKRIAWQRDPNRIAWVVDQAGALFGVTFMPEDEVIGLWRRPMANGAVEDIASHPSSDEGVSEVYLIARRTINSVQRRYVEIMANFFEPNDTANPTAAGAWFQDCALRYQGAPATTISGLSHLVGQTVRALADGVEVNGLVVNGSGQITLPFAASDVIVGIPTRAYVKKLPIEVETQRGTSLGRLKRAHHVLTQVVESAGGRVRANGGSWEQLKPAGAAAYSGAIPLVTENIRSAVSGAKALQCVIELEADTALPFTLAAVTAEMEIEAG